MASTKIWLNVTTSFFWSGPVVGIVRTETEIVKRLITMFQNKIRLCILDEEGFIEICQEDYLSKRNPKKLPQRSIYDGKGRFAKFIFKMKQEDRVFHLTPKILRPLIYNNRRKIKNVINNTRSKRNKDLFASFNKGDVFVTLGLDWQYNFSQHLFSLRKNKEVKVITFCYDLIPILYPQYCVADVAASFKEYFINLSEGSDCIMCISQKTREDLNDFLEHVGARIPKLQTVRLGSDCMLKPHDQSIIRENVEKILSERFILFVSTIERRKNHEVLYRAYHRIIANGKDLSLPKLVFVGMEGWGINELLSDIRLDPLTQNQIVLLGRVNDYELEMLYKKSEFTVFPSLYEGWGLGVAEALQHGKFVIASNTGSLPEVGGDLIWYEDPWNVSGWTEKIQKLCSSPELLGKLTKRVKEEYIPQTWDNACEDLSKEIKCLSRIV